MSSPPVMTETPLQHLLLVDDESAFRAIIADQLSDHGFRVEQAGTGEQAVAQLNDFAFDILITDLRLPGVEPLTGRRDALIRAATAVPWRARPSSRFRSRRARTTSARRARIRGGAGPAHRRSHRC